ncbi:MAG: hypothetical protein AAFO94_07030 [Bacteroidota bacterium]
MFKYLLLLFVLISLCTCNDSLQKAFLTDIPAFPVGEGVTSYQRPITLVRNCRSPLSYIPDTAQLNATPIKYIRVNFHVMRRADGTGNFDEEIGVKEIKNTLRKANYMLANNVKMKLPVGNNTPVLPIQYRYVLTPQPDDPNDDGIYFHNDEELYYLIAKGPGQNNYNRNVFQKYGVQKDTVLNIFVMAYHADSLQSVSYKPRVRGIGFSNFCKVTTWYHQACPESQELCKASFSKYDLDYRHTNLNHEIGHTIGLRHAWGSDGCDDTPHHPNCWGKGAPPCDVEVSNNIMDYNAAPKAWSPCQIGMAHYRFARKNSSIRKLLVPTWCEFKEDKTVVIRDSVVWRGAKDLEGHLIVESGASLTLQCRLSLPAGGKLIVRPGARLVLDGATLENACGEQWAGIEVQEQKKKTGEVFYINKATITDVANPVHLAKAALQKQEK